MSAIIAAGGRGLRFGDARPKQLRLLAGRSILERSVEAFARHDQVTEVVVALPEDLLADPPAFLARPDARITLVPGGARRQDSVANAFRTVAGRADLVVIHDAARPLVSAGLITRTIEAAEAHGAAIAAVPSVDTVKRAGADGLITATLPRGEIHLAQTPQAFRTEVLASALARAAEGDEATDEASLVERAGAGVWLVESDAGNLKITTEDDLRMAERLVGAPPALRVGQGYDLHRLVPGRPLVLGGVTIPGDMGLLGHSDADAVCHALTDAVLGAAAAGDIGRHFPDTDPAWQGADSLDLLREAVTIVRRQGWQVVNVDVVVIAQRPKLSPHVDGMRARLAGVLGVEAACVSVKGKTNEGVDAVGAGEAIAVHAVALLWAAPGTGQR
ncbi:MAG: 2-C-methyl-D-erythritol 4-phosphate cytidylyltransferase [Vicinamibacterales bacterium]